MQAEYITHYGSDLSAVNAARVSMDKESQWQHARDLWKPKNEECTYVIRIGGR